MTKKNVIYVGNFHFPDGNAAGKRVYGNALSLKEAGYKVSIIDTRLTVKDINNCQQNDEKGFNCYSLPYPNGIKSWLMFDKYFSYVQKIITDVKSKGEIACVIYYGSPSLSVFNLKIIRYCKKKNIPVLSDCVDWLTVRTNNPFRDLVKKFDDSFQKIVFNSMCDGVICISEYLSSYYKRKNVDTVIIPPLLPKTNCENNSNKFRKIIYAGYPFRKDMKVDDKGNMKDRVDIAIQCLSILKREGYRFQFDIYGFTKSEILSFLPSLESDLALLADDIRFHGHVSNNEVLNALKCSDFTLLLRDKKRDSIAGFPSKIAESISYGVPVIVTSLGDIQDYIIDGRHGFLCGAQNFEKQLSCVRKGLMLSNSDLSIMKDSCSRDEIFYYKKYSETLDRFIRSF